jgi:glyceraldehyde-3-phosphate dehydrogenase/erythrose-4-phosphate dehydrogenase
MYAPSMHVRLHSHGQACFAGHAVRVPLTNSSITDAVFQVKQNTSVEAVNDLLREAAGTYLKNILQVRK